MIHFVSVVFRQSTDSFPKLTETFASKRPPAQSGTQTYWDSDIKGLVLCVGKKAKTWYFQKDVGGKTQRVMIGMFPVITAKAARQVAMGHALEMSRGAGKQVQIGAPTLEDAMEAYLARPKLRSGEHKNSRWGMFDLHLSDWMKLPLDEITKAMAAARHRKLAGRPSTVNHLLKYFRTVWHHARRTSFCARVRTH